MRGLDEGREIRELGGLGRRTWSRGAGETRADMEEAPRGAVAHKLDDRRWCLSFL
jgi:hypothetical protein